MTLPFTYSIVHIRTGINYYGARYCAGCHPDDLGTTYFSSSKVILSLIKKEGVEAFRFKVRKIFKTADESIRWENKFLKRVDAANSNKWYNKHNGDGKFSNTGGYQLTENTKNKQRKPKAESHREKLAEHLAKVRTIPVWTEERKEKQRQLMKNNKFAKGKSRVVSEEEKERKRIMMKGNTNSKGKPRKLITRVCPHCGFTGRGGNMTRYHFDNCTK